MVRSDAVCCVFVSLFYYQPTGDPCEMIVDTGWYVPYVARLASQLIVVHVDIRIVGRLLGAKSAEV
jgi:hypothetical protein